MSREQLFPTQLTIDLTASLKHVLLYRAFLR